MIYHTDEYKSERAILGLEDLSTPSYYDPAAALICARRGTRSFLHELLHLNQLSATTSGLAVTAALAYRNMCVEFRIKDLNERFGAGLWSPVLGWLDHLYQGVGGDEFRDPSYPYYHLSYLKRWIGSADSLLFALGYFDTTNYDDIKYWQERFPWMHIFQDDEWIEHSFYRHVVPFAWMTSGVRALLESSALYLELLYALGSTSDANEALWRKFKSGRWSGAPDPKERDFVYYGAFTEVSWRGESKGDQPPPYHLLPVCAFWALNGPLPHFSFRKEMAIRSAAKGLTWADLAPPAVFETLLSRCSDVAQQTFTSVDELSFQSRKLGPIVDEMFGPGYLLRIGSEDERYTDVVLATDDIGLSYHTALCGIRNDAKHDSRFESFFRYPPSPPTKAQYQLLEADARPEVTNNLRALLLSVVAEHLIPTWSENGDDRFRSPRRLRCPSATADRPLCPSRMCSGVFPGASGLPIACWFQETAASVLSLDVRNIGIVDGYDA